MYYRRFPNSESIPCPAVPSGIADLYFFEATNIMPDNPIDQAQAEAAHVQPIEPIANQAQELRPGKLQKVLPQIQQLSHEVGGIDKLASIVEAVKSAKRDRT
jgi:hypothetical protein